MGRVVEPEDNRTGARVAVLSHKLWRSRFASDRRVVGQTIRISGRPYEVVGIAPPSFVGSGARSGFRIFCNRRLDSTEGQRFSTRGVGQSGSPARTAAAACLRPAGSVRDGGRASGELAAIAATLDTTYPPPPHLKFQHISERSWTAKLASTPDEVANVLDRFGLTLSALWRSCWWSRARTWGTCVLAHGNHADSRSWRSGMRWARRAGGSFANSGRKPRLAVAGGVGSYLVFRTLADRDGCRVQPRRAIRRRTMDADDSTGARHDGARDRGRIAAGLARGLRPRAGAAADAHARRPRRGGGGRRGARADTATSPAAAVAGRDLGRLLHRRDHVREVTRLRRPGTIPESPWTGSEWPC